jgi:hypothetical protein
MVELPEGGWDVHYWLFFPTSTPPDSLATFAGAQVKGWVNRLLHSGQERADRAIRDAGGDVDRAAARLRTRPDHIEWARAAPLEDLEFETYGEGQYVIRPSSLGVRIDDVIHQGHRLLAHQGDWEQVTVRIGANHEATHVVFNYHTSCVAKPIEDAVSADGRVHAWVARGSHASYPSREEVDAVGWGDRVADDIIWDAATSLRSAVAEPCMDSAADGATPQDIGSWRTPRLRRFARKRWVLSARVDTGACWII